MTLKLDGRFLRGEKLERWIRYKGADGSCELHMAFPDPAEWQKFFAARKDKDNDGGDPEFREFLARYVTDWRGLEEDDVPLPFDRRKLCEFLRRDVKFALWVTSKLGDAASFRGPAGDGASSQAGMEDAPAVAG